LGRGFGATHFDRLFEKKRVGNFGQVNSGYFLLWFILGIIAKAKARLFSGFDFLD
jgi:hypothetical protein